MKTKPQGGPSKEAWEQFYKFAMKTTNPRVMKKKRAEKEDAS